MSLVAQQVVYPEALSTLEDTRVRSESWSVFRDCVGGFGVYGFLVFLPELTLNFVRF